MSLPFPWKSRFEQTTLPEDTSTQVTAFLVNQTEFLMVNIPQLLIELNHLSLK